VFSVEAGTIELVQEGEVSPRELVRRDCA